MSGTTESVFDTKSVTALFCDTSFSMESLRRSMSMSSSRGEKALA